MPLNKLLKLYKLTTIVRSVFEENNKYYPHFFLMKVCMSYKDATQFKKGSIKNRPYYLFNDMINIKNFNPRLLGIDKLSCKIANINTYHIEYMTMKSLEHVNIDSEDSLYLIFKNVDGYIVEKSNENKYLILASTHNKKEVLKKYTELRDEIKNQIATTNDGKPIKYKKDSIKIRFESDDYLPLGKILNILSMIIVTRSVFQENNRYYPQLYLHECLYEFVEELQKFYNMNGLMFQKELTLINQINQKNV